MVMGDNINFIWIIVVVRRIRMKMKDEREKVEGVG